MQKVILVVDDEPDNVDVLSIFLKRNGYEILQAYDGANGLLLAESQLPDLILLDIMMHDMDGYQVCETLKADAKTQGIPVIFISAKAEELDKIKGASVGGIGYITKPYSFKQLLQVVKEALE